MPLYYDDRSLGTDGPSTTIYVPADQSLTIDQSLTNISKYVEYIPLPPLITADGTDLTTCKASLSRSINFYNPPSGSNDWYSIDRLEDDLLIIYSDADSVRSLTESVLV